MGQGQSDPAAAPDPRQLDRVATIIQPGDLQARVRLLADEDDVRTVTRLLNRAVLAGLLSVMLLGTPGPNSRDGLN